MFQLPAEDEDFIELGDELEFQPYRTDDPNVWGLLDIATGRHTEVPQTIYLISGDSASKPIGLLRTDGTFVPNAPSNVGKDFIYQDGGADDGQLVPLGRALPGGEGLNASLPTAKVAVVVWDGAMKSPTIDIVEDGEVFTTSEHSRGLILGDYQRHHVETDDAFKSKLNASRPNSLIEQDVRSTNYEHNQRQHQDPDWTPEVRGGSKPRYPTRYEDAA